MSKKLENPLRYIYWKTPDLEELKHSSFRWLEENQNHPKYLQALQRHVQIVLELQKRHNDALFSADVISTLG